MAHVQWTAAAEQNLDDIFDYIAEEHENPEAVAKVLRIIVETCHTHAEFPRMAEARPDLGKNTRSFPVDGYVVNYEPIGDGIRVLLVIHGTRDIPNILRSSFDGDS